MHDLIIVIAFLLYSALREWLQYVHIKDLETKLVARTPEEYAVYKRSEHPVKTIQPKEDLDEYIDPLDADPADALKGLLHE